MPQDRERKQAEADANEARNQAEAANRAKDQFLATLGHELRNPLGALSSAVRVLEGGEVRSDQAARLRYIMGRQSVHLARLVDDLLDIGRLTAGRVALYRRPMDLADCARDCVGTLRFREEYATRKISLQTESVWIEGDPDRIARILTNLLYNALKYTPPQGKILLSMTRQRSSGHPRRRRRRRDFRRVAAPCFRPLRARRSRI